MKPVASSPATAVHPRGGGELAVCSRKRSRMNGSSPRGRGTLPRAVDSAAFGRFIPAGAGNSSPAAMPTTGWPVHPRGGGELDEGAAGLSYEVGSSPRGRGTLVATYPAAGPHRFIPAGAGNSVLPRKS